MTKTWINALIVIRQQLSTRGTYTLRSISTGTYLKRLKSNSPISKNRNDFIKKKKNNNNVSVVTTEHYMLQLCVCKCVKAYQASRNV